MTEEELKNKCKERANIFQQAMENCHSSSPIDCIEWFADRIADLERENAELRNNGFTVSAMTEQQLKVALEKGEQLEKENAELKKQLEMSNKVYNDNCDYSHHIEEQLTKAKDHIKKLLDCLKQDTNDPQTNYYVCQYMDKAEQFLNEVEK